VLLWPVQQTRLFTILEVGWLVGWLNILGQVAGMSSTEFGLSNMIWAAVVVAKDGNYEVTSGKVVGLFAGLLVFHGILVRLGGTGPLMIRPLNAVPRVVQNCLATRHLATFTKGFVFVNLGTTVSASQPPHCLPLLCTILMG
jgi:hypothetical protein